MLRKRLNLIPALTLASLMYGPPVDACSCVKGEETDKSAREYVSSLLRIYPNVVVLKVVEVTDVGPNHERAKLVVIESWKGKYNPGDIVHSDTSGIGGGMCESSVRETRQQEFLYAFVFISSQNLMTLPVGLAQKIFGDIYPWGLLMAASLVISIPVVIFYMYGQRFMIAGLTAGSVKG